VPLSPPRRIPIAKPSTGHEEWEALRRPLQSGWLTQGPEVSAFEAAFAKSHGVQHAIATSSCTAALHLSLTALGIGPGDEVIVPTFTWVATANAVLYCGATPVFVDVDPATYNIDPSKIPAALTARTKAVIAVHLFGLCADIDALADSAGHLPLLEDAACAAGAAYHGQPAGSLGRVGCFSFHPRKSITTGEGGMVTTNDDEIAELVNQLRNHGASVAEEQRHHGPQPYLLPEFNLLGFNYRMTDLQGAIGLVQLAKLDRFIEERQQGADFYFRELADVEWLRLPNVPPRCRHGWQSFVCDVDASKAPLPRNVIMQQLEQQGVSTRPGTHAVHMLQYYQNRFGFQPGDFPVARDCDRNSITIPLHNQMTGDDYQYVVDAIKQICSG
jgi:dTDP-4-amino-4,6-dideoxygalactose transaminase